jgi:hypothetical protein
MLSHEGSIDTIIRSEESESLIQLCKSLSSFSDVRPSFWVLPRCAEFSDRSCRRIKDI